jgi:hypothetical protein
MSKHKLQLDDDYEFLAFGLSCHLKDFRVAWHLSNALHLDFLKDIKKENSADLDLDEFAKFVAKDPDNHLTYIILSNQNEDAYLFKDLKEYDFFILIEGYIDIFDVEWFINLLHGIESFQFVAEMDNSKFNKIQYALFEE